MNKRAFSLVELAVVLVAAGILLSIGAGVVLPIAEYGRTAKIKYAAEKAELWVEEFVRQNARLPSVNEFKKGAESFEVSVEYTPNPDLVKTDTNGKPVLSMPEEHLSYGFDRKNPKNRVNFLKLDSSKPPKYIEDRGNSTDYAFYIDSYLTDGKLKVRRIKRYYDFLTLFAGVRRATATGKVRILTESLPEAKRGLPYEVKLKIEGGTVRDNAPAGEKRSLGVAVGLLYTPYTSRERVNAGTFYSPPYWHQVNTYSSLSNTPSKTFVNLVSAFTKGGREFFLMGRIDGAGLTAPDKNALPQEGNFKTHYPDKDKFLPLSSGAIPSYGRMPTPFPRSYTGEYFDLVVFVRDNYAEDNKRIMAAKRFRVYLNPRRWRDPNVMATGNVRRLYNHNSAFNSSRDDVWYDYHD